MTTLIFLSRFKLTGLDMQIQATGGERSTSVQFQRQLLPLCRPSLTRPLIQSVGKGRGKQERLSAVNVLLSTSQEYQEHDGQSAADASHQPLGRRGMSLQLISIAAGAATAGNLSLSAASSAITDSKTPNLPIEELKSIIERDIRDGQYFITGDLTRSVYRDDCRFKDPTNETVGLSKYLQAVSILFDPAVSKQELLSIEVTGPNTVEAKWTLGGYLKFPWRPRVTPFEGSTRYVVDSDGLVALHDEKWGISPITALLETLTPTFGLKEN